MSVESPRGLRELSLEAVKQLPGLWVAGGLTDAPSEPPSPLGWHLVLEDAELLGNALSRRGASLPRLSRRFVRVLGHGYHAFAPLARAARSLVSLDPSTLALAIASEAREDAGRTSSRRAHVRGLALAQLLVRIRRGLVKLERRVLSHERDAAQHYRWLVEMDLGILPDDALGTTLEECVAIQRTSRGLEIEATLDLLGTYAALVSYAARQRKVDRDALALAALIPDPLELPSATPALAFASAVALDRRQRELGRRADAFAMFVDGFGERGPCEHDPIRPRWRERPEHLARLRDLLVNAGVERAEARLTAARRDREALLDVAVRSFGHVDAALVRALLLATRKLAVLRSRLNLVRARTLFMLRTAVLDVDRRLARLIGTYQNDAFFLELPELLESTVRPRAELAARAIERRHAWTAVRAEGPPPAVLGRDARIREGDGVLSGAGVNGASVEGTAFVAGEFERALDMPPGAVLVARAVDVGWTPLLLAARAVITDAGGITDEGAIAAASLGVPLVIGARDATRSIPSGAFVRVDTRAGTVSREEPGRASSSTSPALVGATR